jgi:hypothetical protein
MIAVHDDADDRDGARDDRNGRVEQEQMRAPHVSNLAPV